MQGCRGAGVRGPGCRSLLFHELFWGICHSGEGAGVLFKGNNAGMHKGQGSHPMARGSRGLIATDGHDLLAAFAVHGRPFYYPCPKPTKEIRSRHTGGETILWSWRRTAFPVGGPGLTKCLPKP